MSNASDLGWALTVLFRQWQRSIEAAVGTLPHGPRGFQVIAALDLDQPPRVGALAAHLEIDRTVFTYVLDDLTEAGLVERRPDPHDRRAQLVVLTPAGRRLLGRLRTAVEAAECEVLSGLDENRAAELRVLLTTAARANQEAHSPDACSAWISAVAQSDQPVR